MVRGDVTPTSDLDITVLLPGPPAPFRESTYYEGWPVELFVHTPSSLAYYRAQDRVRHSPAMMRLVGASVVLVDVDGSGARLQEECAVEVAAGPPQLTPDELSSKRYAITDLLMDLEGGTAADEMAVTGVALWQQAADLLLTGSQRWTGTGKWLLRELDGYDEAHGTSFAADLLDGMRGAVGGDPSRLLVASDVILARFGGRHFAGHRISGEVPRAD